MANIFIKLFLIYALLLVKCNLSFQDNLLYEYMDINKDENILISPYSIYQILFFLSNNTNNTNNTNIGYKKEILQLLYPNKNMNEEKLLKQIYSNIYQIYSEMLLECSTINSLCQSDNCRIYLNDIKGVFYKYFINNNLDYFVNLKCHNIRNYFSTLNEKEIKKFYNSDNINDIGQSILLILSKLYFSGAWEKKFKEKRTISGIFINSNKTQSKVHMMNQDYKNILYYEDKKVQMISLPYISNYLDFQMIIILPNSTLYSSPLNYLKNENIQIEDLNSKLKSKQNINLYLPKFNFAFNSNLNVV